MCTPFPASLSCSVAAVWRLSLITITKSKSVRDNRPACSSNSKLDKSCSFCCQHAAAAAGIGDITGAAVQEAIAFKLKPLMPKW